MVFCCACEVEFTLSGCVQGHRGLKKYGCFKNILQNNMQTVGGSLAIMAAMWQLLLMTETKRAQLDVLLRATVFTKKRSRTWKRQSSLMHRSEMSG